MRDEDTEAYQEMMAVNYKKFWEILTTILASKPLVISVEPVFSKTADPKTSFTIIRSFKGKYYHQLLCRI